MGKLRRASKRWDGDGEGDASRDSSSSRSRETRFRNWERHMSKLKEYAKSGRKDFLRDVMYATARERGASGRACSIHHSRRLIPRRRNDEKTSRRRKEKKRRGARHHADRAHRYHGIVLIRRRWIGRRSLRDTDRFFSAKNTAGEAFRVLNSDKKEEYRPEWRSSQRLHSWEPPAAAPLLGKKMILENFTDSGQILVLYRCAFSWITCHFQGSKLFSNSAYLDFF